MRTLVYIILLFVITACSAGNSFRRELDCAEDELTRCPVRALERLTVMDVSQMDDSASMARWALLYSDALRRNRLTAPSDTIINIAIDYYRGHNDSVNLDKAKMLKDSLASSVLTGSDLLQAQYLQKVREYSLYKERQSRQRIVLWAVIVILCAFSAIIWLYGRLRLKKAETESLLAEAASLRERVDDSSSLQGAVDRLFGSRFELIDRLCSSYYESQGTKAEKNIIVAQVKNEIESLREDKDTFASLERIVNDGRGDMLVKLRNIFPEMKREEYALAVYLACGFSNRAIALLLEEKIENVYKRKSRLKAKIATLRSDEAALFAPIF